MELIRERREPVAGQSEAGLAGSVAASVVAADPAQVVPGSGVEASGSVSRDLIGQLRVLEEMKSAICGLQARVAVAFEAARRAERAGVPAADRGDDAGAEIALARREPPSRGSRFLGLARALVFEMPRTMAALESGMLNEWRATLLVKETACLSAEDRAGVDAELAPDTGTFEGVGDKGVIAAARAAAYRRDPRSVAQRAARAAADRTVNLRPAPDTMTLLTALLPAAQGVAAYAALSRAADSVRARGGAGSGNAERGRGQVMADALVERLTGKAGGISGVEVQLVMTDRTLFQGESEAARLQGYGIVPAQWARELANPAATENTSGGARRAGTPSRTITPVRDSEYGLWLRRLYTAPATGELLTTDSKARLFPPRLRRFIETRDQTCRTPYCDAPIRHIDHVVPWQHGGPTTVENGAGLCEACNHKKEHPGWTAITNPGNPDPSNPDTANPGTGTRHTLKLRTPSGHSYESKAPPLPGHE
ncbi:HNH endonuclease [Paenarthrobacter histidinolovorans]|uniref:HNH endonuclease n=1 Tax=Paenarthrobacter histidinolovorans TaxID=43664 RepID=UPI00166C0EDC|nr:HNH endonuclease signature motif containing protein [Paenarthrobacter histidinolovorans]GGJ16278.1 HNH endonuclease [Paenarthrobacter histidinolovorans]